MHLVFVFLIFGYVYPVFADNNTPVWPAVWPATNSDEDGGGDTDDCCVELKTGIQKFGHLRHCAEGCDPSAPPYGGSDFIDCLTDSCTKHCEEDISGQMDACDNASFNNRLSTACTSKCSSTYKYIPNQGDFSGVKRACTDENKTILKNQLEKECIDKTRQISNLRPGTLICPEGDASNPKCEEFCTRQVQNYLKQGCNSDITTKTGFEGCWKALRDQINTQSLPQDPSQLVGLGFSWQKCAFGMPCAQRIANMFNIALQGCNTLKAQATLCCDDPVKCVDTSKANKALFSDLSASTGMAEKCRLIKETYGEVGNVGQKMANQCRGKASACVQGCGEQISNNFRNIFHQECTFDILKEETYDRAKHTCSPDLVKTYIKKYKEELVTLLAQCEVEGKKSDNLAQSADSVLKSALSAAQCEEQARGGVDIPSPTPSGGTGQVGALSSNTAGTPIGGINGPTLTWRDSEKKDKPLMGGAGGGAFSSRSLSAGGGSSEGIFKGSSGGNSGGISKGSSEGIFKGSSGGIEGAKQKPGLATSNKEGTLKKGEQVMGGGGADSAASSTVAGAGSLKGKEAGKKPGGKDGKADEGTKEEMDKLSQRQFAKTAGNNQKGKSHWSRIKPRQNLNTRVSSFGSPHDDIFRRISNRIIVLCRREKLYCP